MSAKLMGRVWDLALKRPHREVLLAMADHADHLGYCHPGIALLAWKTDYSERQVQRILRDLEALGLVEIVEDGGGSGHVRHYRLHLEKGVEKSPFRASERVTPAQGNGDKPNLQRVTSSSANGDTQMSPEPRATVEPKPSENHASPDGAAADRTPSRRRMRIADHPDAARLCTLLADLIEVNTGQRPNPDQQRWRDAVRLMVTEDSLSVEQIEYLIRWAQANEFWRSNILSTPKLREKRITLIAQIQRERAAAYGSRQASLDASVAELLVGSTTGGTP